MIDFSVVTNMRCNRLQYMRKYNSIQVYTCGLSHKWIMNFSQGNYVIFKCIAHHMHFLKQSVGSKMITKHLTLSTLFILWKLTWLFRKNSFRLCLVKCIVTVLSIFSVKHDNVSQTDTFPVTWGNFHAAFLPCVKMAVLSGYMRLKYQWKVINI